MDYTKKDVAKVTGLTPRLVQFYTENGVITPARFEGEGRGGIRYYSKDQLLEFAIIEVLSRNGITIQVVKMIIHHIQVPEQNIFEVWQKIEVPTVYLNIYQLNESPNPTRIKKKIREKRFIKEDPILAGIEKNHKRNSINPIIIKIEKNYIRNSINPITEEEGDFVSVLTINLKTLIEKVKKA